MALLLFIAMASASDPFFELALHQLASFNSRSSDAARILQLLEVSAQHGNPAALTKLGQAFLFGLPASLARNFTLAHQYLTLAAQQSDPDASFLLSFMHSQGTFVEQLSGFPPHPLRNQSELLTISSLSSFLQCTNSHFLPLPRPPAPCPSCEALIQDALSLAGSAVQFIQKQGAVAILPRLLLHEQSKGSENSLKLYSRFTQQKDDLEGLVLIGDNYLHGNPGIGLERSVPQALAHYEMAAQRGSAEAFENLGVMHMHGIGVPLNLTKAQECLERAQNRSSALNGLGLLGLKSGDRRKAFRLFKQAAEANDLGGMANVGMAYMHGIGTPKNPPRALEHLLPAAEAGHFNAMFNLALMYHQEPAIKRSCVKALKLAQQVIHKGRLGGLLARAHAFYTLADYPASYLLYALAAELGYEVGMMNAAFLLEREPGHYYRMAAAAHKSELAFLKLGDIAYKGAEYKQAYEFFGLARRYPQAAFAMAYMRQHGLGVPQDLDTAEELYREAQQESSYPAGIALALIYIRRHVGGLLAELVDYASSLLN